MKSTQKYGSPKSSVCELSTPTEGQQIACAADVHELADQLRKAAAAHHVYEINLGVKDEDWATWYAAYMLGLEKEPVANVGDGVASMLAHKAEDSGMVGMLPATLGTYGYGE